MENRIKIALPEKLQNTISLMQADGNDMARYYVDLVDQVMTFYLKEDVQVYMDMNEKEILQFISGLMSLKRQIESFIV